jgi:hypothetical protein
MWQIRFISLYDSDDETMGDIQFHIRDHSGNITDTDAKRLARRVERLINAGWELQGFCTHPFGAWVRRQQPSKQPAAIGGGRSSGST